MSFDADTFVADASRMILYSLQLKQVIDKVGTECDTNVKKAELQKVLLDYFIKEGLIFEQLLTSNNA